MKYSGECSVCSKYFNNLGGHISAVHKDMTIEEYYNRFLKTSNSNSGYYLECGSKTKFYSLVKGYNKYCSNSCALKNKDLREQIKNTNIDRYGYTTKLVSPEVLEKSVEKAKSYKSKLKRENTNLVNRGVRYPAQSQVVRDKQKLTMLNKYGVDNVWLKWRVLSRLRRIKGQLL